VYAICEYFPADSVGYWTVLDKWKFCTWDCP